MNSVKLDPAKLMGIRIVAREEASVVDDATGTEPVALGTKLGQKAGSKIGVKDGLKLRSGPVI